MKKVLALNGSMRRNGNTSILLRHFLNGAGNSTGAVEEIIAHDINLEYCRGCLRCNLIGKCSVNDDDWVEISSKILDADVIVFASPIYFHHITASLKKVIERFRSFVHVQITETGLKHTPREEWNKDFVLLLCMGSSDVSDSDPVIELFKYIKSILGPKNRLHIITATRLAVVNQVSKTEAELEKLYPKLNLPANLAKEDYRKNQKVIKQCFELGKGLAK
ncbi:MAG: flavodoxin family protein [Bacteroidales bacterium]|nr:MAG: flavodoxin family protein [Bacteroidales bacterium]